MAQAETSVDNNNGNFKGALLESLFRPFLFPYSYAFLCNTWHHNGQSPMNQERHQESEEVRKIIQVVPAAAIRCSANLPHKARKKWPCSHHPRRRRAPVETSPVPILGVAVADVEVLDADVLVADEEIVADEDARHGTEEHGPAGEDGDEGCGLCDEVPWAGGYGEDG